MLNPQITRHILHVVNLQVNSNHIFIKPTPPLFNIFSHLNLCMQTRKSLSQLHKKFPKQRLSTKSNLYSQFAQLYSQFRIALSDSDDPLLHRYLTNALYQQYKQKNKQAFNIYSTVYNLSLKQAQIYENQYGKWIQCLIQTTHDKNIRKQHIVERKLDNVGGGIRTWYFVRFTN